MTTQEKFQHLLRELFQFDSTDLDFGIYRIMNYKRDVIEKFIAEDLPKAISDDLEQGLLADQDRAAAELAEIAQEVKDNFGEDAMEANGELVSFQTTPLGRKYLNAKAKAAGARSRDAVEIDIFNHLYAFFSRYYADGDFISKRRYAKHQQYAIPYNGEEVHLHWANRDQYYVKTGEHFRDYDWKAPNGIAVHFRIKAADVEQNNVKGDKRFFLPLVAETNYDENTRAIAIPFEYRPLTEGEKRDYGKTNQQDKIIAAAVDAIPNQIGATAEALPALTGERRRNGDGESISHLEHHLRQYTRRNTSDFFIHKDLKGFLSRELDFYLKNEVLNLDEMAAIGENMAGGWFQIMRVIKVVGGQIIDFLDQIECFQKMLWEKRKFITETQHCITLGIIDEKFYPTIAACEPQWAEWKALFHIDEDALNLFNSRKDTQGKRAAFMQAHPTLVLNTRHFTADFTDQLLASFDDLDEMTDGLLIHSENYQALNLLQEKYAEQVKCIYIDPPYNTGDDGFIYRDAYQHSCWLAMMRDRAMLSKFMMTEKSSFWANLDDIEIAHFRLLLDSIFGPEHFIGNIAWKKTSGDNKPAFAFVHDNLVIYGAEPTRALPSPEIAKQYSNPDNDPRGDWASSDYRSKWHKQERPNLYYGITHPNTGEIIYPDSYSDSPRVWGCDKKTHKENEKNKLVWWGNDGNSKEPRKKRFLSEHRGLNIRSIWDDAGTNDSASKNMRDLFGFEVNSRLNPKPWELPKKICGFTSREALIADYFAGSGTTGHAVINLNREDGGRRKFMLVEMAEYFDTVLLPRIEKIIFTPEWKDGKPKRLATPDEAERSPRIVKYMRVENYEDALNNIAFDDATAQLNLAQQLDDYLIKYMLQWETKDSETLLNVAKLTRPFTYRLRVRTNGETQERMADIPETFNYLLGLNVRTRRVHQDEGRRYVVYRGKTRDAPGREVAVIWRETEGWARSDFDRDRRFVAEQGLIDSVAVVYVNGDSCIPGAIAVEPMFKARMFAEVAK